MVLFKESVWKEQEERKLQVKFREDNQGAWKQALFLYKKIIAISQKKERTNICQNLVCL